MTNDEKSTTWFILPFRVHRSVKRKLYLVKYWVVNTYAWKNLHTVLNLTNNATMKKITHCYHGILLRNNTTHSHEILYFIQVDSFEFSFSVLLEFIIVERTMLVLDGIKKNMLLEIISSFSALIERLYSYPWLWKPILGKRLYRGVCPPSKALGVDLLFWCPWPLVLPLLLPTPLPHLLLCMCDVHIKDLVITNKPQ